MRVNISYSVELEKVPQEVDKLLTECEGIFRMVCGRLDTVTGPSPLETIENLQAIRQQLRITDVRLEECVHILSGYVDIKTKTADHQEAEQLAMEEDDEQTL